MENGFNKMNYFLAFMEMFYIEESESLMGYIRTARFLLEEGKSSKEVIDYFRELHPNLPQMLDPLMAAVCLYRGESPVRNNMVLDCANDVLVELREEVEK